MEELLEEIQNIQKYLNGGYKAEGSSNLEWLNNLSLQFSKMFKLLHKFLVFDLMVLDNKQTIIEQSFLCANQIIVCLKFIEKTVHKEVTAGCLITSRQCFFERILWCLAKLKSTVRSANDDVLVGEPENFISLLDYILESLSPFSGLDCENKVNKAEQRAELMMESKEIKTAIDRLLSQAMTFANVVIESDKNPIRTLSQNVYKAGIEFEEEFSIKEGKKVDKEEQRMKSIELENSLCSLENYVNDALIRLVFEVFQENDEKVVDKLKNSKNSEELELEIEKFDLFVDRLIQIGHFAIWYSRDNQKISSTVRSCLASIESLDMYLIPALTSGKSEKYSSNLLDPSIDILQEHFEQEVTLMQSKVQEIIDTQAFCSSLVDQLNSGITSNQKSFNTKSLFSLISRSQILLQHLQINAKSLQISQDKIAKFYFGDFKLILSECEAILKFDGPIEDFERRTLKRFKVLSNTVGKLEKAFKILQNSNLNEDKNENREKLKNEEFPSKCSDYFNSIRPSALGSILYESKRSIKAPRNLNTGSIIRKSTRNKRKSLRMTIFKNQHEVEKETAWNQDAGVSGRALKGNQSQASTECNETMDLQITEILDRIHDLSTTLAMKSNLV